MVPIVPIKEMTNDLLDKNINPIKEINHIIEHLKHILSYYSDPSIIKNNEELIDKNRLPSSSSIPSPSLLSVSSPLSLSSSSSSLSTTYCTLSCSSTNDHTNKKYLKDIRKIKSFDKIEKDIELLKEQLNQTIAEKNYWMKQCKLLNDGQGNQTPPGIPVSGRRRSNSELQVIADTLARPGQYGIDTKVYVPLNNNNNNNNNNNKLHTNRSMFRLLQCSDEQCEVFKPSNNNIRTSHHARSNIQFMWDEPPKTVLIIKKPNDIIILNVFINIIKWMTIEKKFNIYIESIVQNELKLDNVYTWENELEWNDVQEEIDFIICLGGDGTILWASGLFKKSVPPIMSFAMGSLGFLTPFDYEFSFDHIENIIKGGFYLSLRSRIQCFVIKYNNKNNKLDNINNNNSNSNNNDIEKDINIEEKVLFPNSILSDHTKSFHALNEVVIDRGPSASIVELDCYCDGIELTKVSADGIIIATPTGSTAYSLSAGGSMVHPSVPTMLFTPICPHSLSFRPLLFNDNATLKIVVPLASRTCAYVSFDGRNRLQLEKGDELYVKVSPFPIPVICCVNENVDWFESVKNNLNWNQRKAQKSIKDDIETI